MGELEFVICDPRVCTGCMICVNVCSMRFFKTISPARSRTRVLRVEPALDFALFCRNCEDAPCIDACPEGAISRTKKGTVIINQAKCTGTGICIDACPYAAIKINPDTGKAIKCIQCGECIERCPVDALEITTRKKLAHTDPDGEMLALHDRHADSLYQKEDD